MIISSAEMLDYYLMQHHNRRIKIDSASEWKTDEKGVKYRKIGNSIEYMPTIVFHGMEIPQDELKEFYSKLRRSEAKKGGK